MKHFYFVTRGSVRNWLVNCRRFGGCNSYIVETFTTQRAAIAFARRKNNERQANAAPLATQSKSQESEMKQYGALSQGDRVAFNVKFLRNTGQTTGRKPKQMKRRPLIGEAFNPEQGNSCEDLAESMARELEHYRPRGGMKLAKELSKLAHVAESERMDSLGSANPEDVPQYISEAVDEACELLTEWARRIERHDYISFECYGDFAGFRIDVESAINDADWRCDDGNAPYGFSGLLVTISDHGNVSAYRYSRGRKTRELFAVV